MNVTGHKLKGKRVLRDEAGVLVRGEVMQRIANLGYYAGGWLSHFVRAISSLPAFHLLHPLNQIEWYVAWQYLKNIQVELLWLRRVAQSKSAMGRQKLGFLCLLKSPPTPTTTTGTPSHFQWTSRLSENLFADINNEGYLKVLSKSWAFQNCDLDAEHHSELCREDGMEPGSLRPWEELGDLQIPGKGASGAN